MSDPLADNVAHLRERIAKAAVASGRVPEAVTLVAVTKTLPAALLRRLVGLGCFDLGESRPQELWGKAAALDDLPVRWHAIGHLQRNKLRRTLPLVHLIHSVDSERLLAALQDEAALLGRRLPALLEVNISGEPAKHGFAPEYLPRALEKAAQYPAIEIRGLMGMAGLGTDEPDAAETATGTFGAERDFERLRNLRDRLTGELPPEVSLPELSMGMSGDFEAAIRQGATLVRIGSALTEET